MTEAEWLACEDPASMLVELAGTATRRKMLLLAARNLRHSTSTLGLSDTELEWLASSAEGLADGRLTPAQINQAAAALADGPTFKNYFLHLLANEGAACAPRPPSRGRPGSRRPFSGRTEWIGHTTCRPKPRSSAASSATRSAP